MVRALNVYQGAGGIGRFIQRLESWGEEWEAAGAIGTGDEEEDKAKELLREVALRRAEKGAEAGGGLGWGSWGRGWGWGGGGRICNDGIVCIILPIFSCLHSSQGDENVFFC
jgi:hypothetical protein